MLQSKGRQVLHARHVFGTREDQGAQAPRRSAERQLVSELGRGRNLYPTAHDRSWRLPTPRHVRSAHKVPSRPRGPEQDVPIRIARSSHRHARDGRPVALLRCPPDASHAPKYGSHTKEVLESVSVDARNFATTWSRTYIPYSSKCECCFSKGRKNYVLMCNHTICFKCWTDTICPVCQTPHIMNRTLRTRFLKHRHGYSNWRMGNAQGCRDLEAVARPRLSI